MAWARSSHSFAINRPLAASSAVERLKDHPLCAYQLRRYAWSAKPPISILTNFRELVVYDCRVEPTKDDKSSTARVLLLTYKDYADRWDDLAAIFSRDAVLRGSFDAYAVTMKGKRGTAEVDDAFLTEMQQWRELLARHIALRNRKLAEDELNYAVQQTTRPD